MEDFIQHAGLYRAVQEEGLWRQHKVWGKEIGKKLPGKWVKSRRVLAKAQWSTGRMLQRWRGAGLRVPFRAMPPLVDLAAGLSAER